MISDEELNDIIAKYKKIKRGNTETIPTDFFIDDILPILIELQNHRKREEAFAKIFQKRMDAVMQAERQKKRDIQDEIIAAVLAERRRQDEKWGEQNHPPQFWTGILGEEFGELCQAVNETVFNNGPEERKKGGYVNMRKESIHVAAVAVGFLECLERNKGDADR